jgi:predicted TIM-barrel fold metal-dependent hydrolase
VPGYRGRRSLALPEFDPFWDRVEELGTLVCLHASDSGYTRYLDEWEATHAEMLPFGEVSPFMLAAMHGRAIQDTILSLIGHGCLHRHPKLKFISVENGSDWVRPLVDHLDVVHRRYHQSFPEHPRETFRRHIWVHPFHEEDPIGLIELMGADRVCFGSDYPHVEGMSDPVSWVDEIADLPLEQIERVMGGNARGLMGLEALV